MSNFRAHIKSIKNQSISIYIIDNVIGSIEQEHTINKIPSDQSRAEARQWVSNNYENIRITEEGYFPNSPMTNEAGALMPEGAGDRTIDYPTPPSALPSIDTQLSPGQLEGGAITQSQITTMLQNYASILNDNYLVTGKNTGVPTYARDAAAEIMEQDYLEELEDARLSEEMDNYIDVRDNQYVLDGDTTSKSQTLKNLENKAANDASGDRQGNEFQVEFFDTGAAQEFNDYTDQEGKLDEFIGPDREKPPVFPKVKKAVQLDGLPANQLENLKMASNSSDPKKRVANRGLSGDHLTEPVPQFQQAKSEVVFKNKNNAWIVLGRDRPSNLTSGYGGKGHTQAGAIDICVGRMSPYVRQVDFDDKPVKVDPMFMPEQSFAGPVTDAARIYLSQKTDVDDNFKLVKGRIGNMKARSAIALKADAVRIIARDQGIKLVTRGKDELRNSQGGNSKVIRGVDIIANNDDSNLQPMVLGANLTACLTEMADILSDVVGSIQALTANQCRLDIALSTHFHPAPFFAGPTLNSPTLMVQSIAALMQKVSIVTFSNAATKFNMVGFKQKYLGFQVSSPSKAPTTESVPITSKYNHVN